MKFYSLFVVINFCFVHPAWACVQDAVTLHTPVFLFVLMASTVCAGALVFWIRKLRTSIVMVATMLGSILLGVFGSVVIPSFAKVLESFSGELPWQTAWVISAPHALWLPALCTLVLWLVSRKNPPKQRYFASILFGEIVLFIGVVEALYSPIFVFGCVV